MALTGIWLMVTSPNVTVSPSPAQPASDTTAYYYEAQDGEDVAAVVQRVAGLFAVGCTLIAVDVAQVQTFTIAPTIQPT